MVQSDSETLQKLVKGQKLELAERAGESEPEERAAPAELMVAEAVIKPASWVKGRTAATLELRRHWQVNLLALSRQGRPIDRSEEHTSELHSLMRTTYAVFCLQKIKTKTNKKTAE